MCSKKLGLHGKGKYSNAIKKPKKVSRAKSMKKTEKKSDKQIQARMTEAEWYFLMNEDILN